MELTIEIYNLKPINTNNYQKITTRGRFASKYKTAEAVEFESEIENQILQYMPKIKKFNDHYDSKKHFIICDYKFYFPVLTKKGLIAKRKNDVDNLIKPFQDCIFKYFKPDDSEIIHLSASKIHHLDYKIEVSIKSLHIEHMAQLYT